MAVELVNPEGLPKAPTHRQVSVATGSRLVFMAGQVAWDADGNTVGAGDLAAQVEQCYLNVAAALAEVGGSFDDVAKLTIYVPDWTHDKYPLLEEGIARASAKLGITPLVPISLIGISALFTPISWSRSRPPRSSTERRTMRRPGRESARRARPAVLGPLMDEVDAALGSVEPGTVVRIPRDRYPKIPEKAPKHGPKPCL